MPTFLISDQSVNNYGYRILMEGGDLAFFLKNPVLLYNHHRSDSRCSVYGRWENVSFKTEGGVYGLYGDPVFDLEDEEGLRISRKVENGFLNACSINIRPLEISDDQNLKLPGQHGPTVVKWQLREASIVDIPGNGMAVKLCDAAGVEIDPYQLSDLIGKPTPPMVAPKTMDDLKYLAATLGLRSDATLSDVNHAINELKDAKHEAEALKLRLAAFEKDAQQLREAESLSLLDAAEKEGKITSATRTVYANALKADFQNGKALLAALPTTVKLSEVTPGAGSGRTTPDGLVDGKYNGKTFDELSRLNDGADLAKLKESDFQTFNALFKQTYGTDFRKGK